MKKIIYSLLILFVISSCGVPQAEYDKLNNEQNELVKENERIQVELDELLKTKNNVKLIYEYDNAVYSQEEIDRRAYDLGESTDEYLKRNPSIKKIKVNPSKTTNKIENNYSGYYPSTSIDQKFLSTVSKNNVEVGEEFQIIFTANGSASEFRAPNFLGLRKISGPNKSSSSSMQIINGTINSTKTTSFSFNVSALSEGELTIPTATIKIEGKKIQSLPIKITIKKAVLNKKNIQNDYRIGNYTTFKKNNIVFQVKQPLPSFVQSKESHSLDGNNNLVVSYETSKHTNTIVLQVYTTPIPERFSNINVNELFSSEESSKKFLNDFLGANTKLVISNHKTVNLNGKNFLVATSTVTYSGVTQKQINWITIHKNNFINIVGSTFLSSFDENLLFIENFGSSILID